MSCSSRRYTPFPVCGGPLWMAIGITATSKPWRQQSSTPSGHFDRSVTGSPERFTDTLQRVCRGVCQMAYRQLNEDLVWRLLEFCAFHVSRDRFSTSAESITGVGGRAFAFRRRRWFHSASGFGESGGGDCMISRPGCSAIEQEIHREKHQLRPLRTRQPVIELPTPLAALTCAA